MAIANQRAVLIVEDDLPTRRTLAAIIRFKNYKVLEASNGIGALNALRMSRPYVVISDLQMPSMDGYTLLRIMAEYFPEMGTIVLSGAFDQERGRLISVNADAFFAKGAFATKSLLNCVDELADRFPLRPLSKRGLLSMAWSPQGSPESVWIACRDCLHCFVWADTDSVESGMHEACCPSCSGDLRFVVEKAPGLSSKRDRIAGTA